MRLIAALALVLGAQDPLERRIDELVARFAEDEIEKREEAFRALVDLGEPALPILKKLANSRKDAEVLARLRAASRQIEENVARSKVYRPARPVTLRAREAPLRDVVRDACAQAGVEFEVPASLGDRKVTLEADREPLLKALDRLCAGLGGVSTEIAEGKVRFVNEKFPACPAAYADGFRARLKRVTTFGVNDFNQPTATVILYFAFDAQPDLRPRSVAYADAPRAEAPSGELTFKPVWMGRRGGMSSSGARGIMTVDDVPIPFDADVRIETACFLKDGPAALGRLDRLRVKAKYRFSTGIRPVKCSLSSKGEVTVLENLPVRATFMGSYVQLMPTGADVRLEDLLDVNSVSIVGKDGKEEKCVPTHSSPSYYLFRCNADASVNPELQLSVYDGIFEKEVEFELRDVPLRP